MSPERKLEAYLVDQCKKLGFLCRKVQWLGRSGAPDRVVFLPEGKTLWIELKSPAGRVSEIQRLEFGRMEKLGHDVWIAYTREQIDNLLAGEPEPEV
jgi:hypothetical protein